MSAAMTATVRSRTVQPQAREATATPPARFDSESQAWLRSLRSDGVARDDAQARLHALLLRAARFEVARRRTALAHLRDGAPRRAG